MKPTRNVRLGRICKKHPDENGLRYVGNNRCVECAKEESRKHYASLELTPAQKITTLLGEIAQLKVENETLRKNSERYVWLRDKSENLHGFYLSTPLWMTGVRFSKQNVDDTIDAAMLPGDQL